MNEKKFSLDYFFINEKITVKKICFFHKISPIIAFIVLKKIEGKKWDTIGKELNLSSSGAKYLGYKVLKKSNITTFFDILYPIITNQSPPPATMEETKKMNEKLDKFFSNKKGYEHLLPRGLAD